MPRATRRNWRLRCRPEAHVSPSSRTTFMKRQKERARQEKQRSKMDRRAQKKQEQSSAPLDSLIDTEAAASQMLTPEELQGQREDQE